MKQNYIQSSQFYNELMIHALTNGFFAALRFRWTFNDRL
jgi:hypothetical protein